MNERTFYKERKFNNRSFDFLSKQNIIVPLMLDINDDKFIITKHKCVWISITMLSMDFGNFFGSTKNHWKQLVDYRWE